MTNTTVIDDAVKQEAKIQREKQAIGHFPTHKYLALYEIAKQCGNNGIYPHAIVTDEALMSRVELSQAHIYRIFRVWTAKDIVNKRLVPQQHSQPRRYYSSTEKGDAFYVIAGVLHAQKSTTIASIAKTASDSYTIALKDICNATAKKDNKKIEPINPASFEESE